ncbi:hypothetical protein SAMN04489761_0614 [Tenacibaculum sp. MAR_2009_124]|uniref:hypothetical protein n=1 Tax=Tenacibaculum sp. MAR_2009_124 TaxID=1250059 RepID=UPI00089B918C|nr:hypothetical protein [Tenacibaculum sp. MAR_2009_124]SEB42216.1 hypothetical protein SAMN04489761_0614 [Tenacibaculum sp. MAR_2009_124]
MKRTVFTALLFFFSYLQYANSNTFIQQKTDSLNYASSMELQEDRSFKENLNEKYNGTDFIYTEEKEKPVKEKSKKKSDPNTAKVFANFFTFLASIFPYLLALLVVFILIKSFVYNDKDLWKFKKTKIPTNKKLIYEDEEEDIHENDFERLLKRAKNNGDFRLATRYYYLLLLKNMSKKNLIDYHKDKTNSQYIFELKNAETRKQFSYLLYIYDYVWYGEFPVDDIKFENIENNYSTFIKKL